jgi:hypothetical protein
MHPQYNIQFDLGNLVKGQSTNHTIKFENVFDNPYNIRKITPFCPCIKITEFTEYGIYSVNDPKKEEGDVDHDWTIDFAIKKQHLGKGSTQVEVILESPFDTEQFVIITVKYNVISN